MASRALRGRQERPGTTQEPHPPVLARSVAYSVPEGVAADGVLGGQGRAAQHDEDEDEVGEDVVVDELVAAHADAVGRISAWTSPSQHPGPARWPGSGRGGRRCAAHTHPADQNHPHPPSRPEPPDRRPSKPLHGRPCGPECGSVWELTDTIQSPSMWGLPPAEGEETEAEARERAVSGFPSRADGDVSCYNMKPGAYFPDREGRLRWELIIAAARNEREERSLSRTAAGLC